MYECIEYKSKAGGQILLIQGYTCPDCICALDKEVRKLRSVASRNHRESVRSALSDDIEKLAVAESSVVARMNRYKKRSHELYDENKKLKARLASPKNEIEKVEFTDGGIVKEVIIRRNEILLDGKPLKRIITDINYSARKDFDIIDFVCFVEDSDGLGVVNAKGDEFLFETIRLQWVHE